MNRAWTYTYYLEFYFIPKKAPSLNWSDTLAARAQLWADDLANRDAFEHDSSRGMEGENIYKSNIDSPTACKNGTYAFYKEEKFYDYDNPGFSMAVGHFTQVAEMMM